MKRGKREGVGQRGSMGREEKGESEKRESVGEEVREWSIEERKDRERGIVEESEGRKRR